MVPLLSTATVSLTGHIVPCPCCGMAHALRPLRHHDPRLVVDCGDRTLVMGEGAHLYRRPQLLIDAA
jgi:hypothetical protein